MNRILLAGAALATFAGAVPAAAQDSSWSGPYVGGRLGYAFGTDEDTASLQFDNNLDGTFGDTVSTAAGINAFTPGFCGGSAEGTAPINGCDKDDDGIDYGVYAGYDFDFGSLVVGGLVEYGQADVEDSVSGFSTTPASYTLSRRLKGTLGVRARVGLDAGDFLPYVTAGLVRAKVKSSFNTSNTANAFALSDSNHTEGGYRLGAGVETKAGPVALGLLYLYTSVKDDTEVAVTQGTAPATNPFVRVNSGGTIIRPSEDRLSTHSVALTASFRF